MKEDELGPALELKVQLTLLQALEAMDFCSHS